MLGNRPGASDWGNDGQQWPEGDQEGTHTLPMVCDMLLTFTGASRTVAGRSRACRVKHQCQPDLGTRSIPLRELVLGLNEEVRRGLVRV